MKYQVESREGCFDIIDDKEIQMTYPCINGAGEHDLVTITESFETFINEVVPYNWFALRHGVYEDTHFWNNYIIPAEKFIVLLNKKKYSTDLPLKETVVRDEYTIYRYE